MEEVFWKLLWIKVDLNTRLYISENICVRGHYTSWNLTELGMNTPDGLVWKIAVNEFFYSLE